MLDKLVTLCGGTVCKDEKTWFLLARPAKELLEKIYPIMSSKRQFEINKVLEKYKHVGVHNKNKTHCKHGHLFTEDNIYWRHGTRQCKTCTRLRKKKYYAQNPDKYKAAQVRYLQRKKERKIC